MPENIPKDIIADYLILNACRTAEMAALAASQWIGKGDNKAADNAAVQAMRNHLNSLAISGTVVIGEGERDKAPMLYIGEKVGRGGFDTQIALDPLEGTTVCANNGSNVLAVIGITENGEFLHAPDVYMQKIAVGFSSQQARIDLDASPKNNITAAAKALAKDISDVVVCVLDRPRHQQLIEDIRATGARIKLIGDGDIYAIIATALAHSGIDMYMGSGGSPEGVLAAAALRAVGGQMQARLILDTKDKQNRAKKEMAISDPNRKYNPQDLASGDVIFAACGVTRGDLVEGVNFSPDRNSATTQTIIMRSKNKTIQKIQTKHNLAPQKA